jgi:hypothetical protein
MRGVSVSIAGMMKKARMISTYLYASLQEISYLRERNKVPDVGYTSESTELRHAFNGLSLNR